FVVPLFNWGGVSGGRNSKRAAARHERGCAGGGDRRNGGVKRLWIRGGIGDLAGMGRSSAAPLRGMGSCHETQDARRGDGHYTGLHMQNCCDVATSAIIGGFHNSFE